MIASLDLADVDLELWDNDAAGNCFWSVHHPKRDSGPVHIHSIM